MPTTLLASLRALAPHRQLSAQEAYVLAEQQADLARQLLGLIEPSVSDRVFAALPRLEVLRVAGLGVAGTASWHAGKWRIVVDLSGTYGRQRFAIAHQLKHVIDHVDSDVLYGRGHGRNQAREERACDRFAAAWLMPTSRVREAVDGGVADCAQLAREFGVSQQAMHIRLVTLGLVTPQRRCPHDPR